MEIVGFTNIFREPIMENIGFTNISNNFHDFPNYGSGSQGFPKIMEIVGFINIFREPIMGMVGFTNNFLDSPDSKPWFQLTRFFEIHGNCWNCWFYQHFP